MNSSKAQFFNLTPHLVLESVEKQGFCPTGRYTQLNSYENRVFHIETEDQPHGIVAKFYRPKRWPKEALMEEHAFLFELAAQGIPAVTPLKLSTSDKATLPNKTLFECQGIYACVFPKQMGRIPQELSLDEFKQVGRLLARMHNLGKQKQAAHRPFLTTEWFGDQSLDILEHCIWPELKERYFKAAENVLWHLDDHLDSSSYVRIHGDCHKGNLLQTDPVEGAKEFFFVDFDDFINGPPVYDFWMLFSGDNTTSEQEALLSGYTELRNFNLRDLELISPLRALRMIYYSAWIARRWNADPSFKKLFPNFDTYNYWAEETETLEKISWLL